MAHVLHLDNLQSHYQRVVDAFLRRGPLTLNKGMGLALGLYQKVKIAGISGEDAEDDMLLFQYGICDWGDAKGKYFGLDLTRQLTFVETGEEDEPLLYQLCYEFQFDPVPFADCKHYNSWSGAESDLLTWAATQQATTGFQLACTRPFRALEITLSEV